MILPLRIKQKLTETKIRNIKKEVSIYNDYSEKKIKMLESKISDLEEANERFREEIFQLRNLIREYENKKMDSEELKINNSKRA